MPWNEVTRMSLKQEFVILASEQGVNFSQLCARYGISRKTGYKLLKRYKEFGLDGLQDKSRRPINSPNATADAVIKDIINTRLKHPCWGARKIKQFLEKKGVNNLPASSTIHEILNRNNLLDPEESSKHMAFKKFEHEAPNDLWQMDFKGDFMIEQKKCFPLTVLDDHSRYSIMIKACETQTFEAVHMSLIDAFRRHGLPKRMNMDNGSPWAGRRGSDGYTRLTAFLIRLGIIISFSRPHHPQTNGKIERFHRTFKAEALTYSHYDSFEEAQDGFDKWRTLYNTQRPHQAIGMRTPIERYKISDRTYPEVLPPIEYGADDEVRKVQSDGTISYKGNTYKISKALVGQPVALRPTEQDRSRDVIYCCQKVAYIELPDR